MLVAQKFFKFFICASFISMFSAMGAGIYYEEVGGYLFFGILVAAFFVDGVIITSLFCNKREFYVSRRIWFLLSFFVLILSLYFVPSAGIGATSELGLIIDYPMLILSMPIGGIGSFIVSELLTMNLQNFYLDGLFQWTVYFVLGYAQWFVVVPFLVRGEVPR